MKKGFHFNKHRSFVSRAPVGPGKSGAFSLSISKAPLKPGIVRSNLW